MAVGVSGGPDSLALAALLAAWAPTPPVALVVDHGLRAASADEARVACERAAGLGCEPVLLTLRGLRDGPALQRRAADARHAALADACRTRILLDLFLAHHRDDQAETRRLRRDRGSDEDGLDGMAAIAERADLRILRPLLGVGRGRLRATLSARGVAWFADPANEDVRFARARLRARFPDGVPEPDADAGRRAERDAASAAFLARHVRFREEGFALVDAAEVPPRILGALIRTVSGGRYAPGRDALRSIASPLRPATLGGVRIARAPARIGARFTLSREAAAMAPPVAAGPGAVWDGRFRLRHEVSVPEGVVLRALGADAARARREARWPAAILRTLPVLSTPDGAILDPIFLARGREDEIPVIFSPLAPALPSFFMIGRQDDVVSSSVSVR